MPQLRIVTNLPKDAIPPDFLMEATQVFQATIGKPMKYISVCVMPGQLMTFSGTDDPCALMHIGSIGKLGVEENKQLSAIIFKLIKEKLNIDGTRAYLTFHDQERSEVGYNGNTFAQ